MGYLDRHPFKGKVRLSEEKPRTRYVEDWEIVECLSLQSRRNSGSVLAIQAYMRIKLLTGMRRGDLLRLAMSDLKDDGIRLTPGETESSTGKRLIIEWTDELRAAGSQFVQSFFLHGYSATARGNAISTMPDAPVAGTRCGAISSTASSLHARALLAHADGKITERVYRRKPERVKPLR